ncbi:MAG: hypothetical protein Q9225_006497 [Loekoesia sp. 1 TL-2023]
MAQTNHIEKVAIVGATGRIGKQFAEDLLKTGKHTITALTRPDSKGTLPPGVHPIQANYDDDSSLISALRGQHLLIITLSVLAPPDLHSKIVHAAVKAGVPYIIPNTYGSDILNKGLVAEDLYSAGSLQKCQEVESLGASYIAVVCGFWYEWSLALGEPWFGFDIKERKVTFFDDGKTKICSSTWAQCGRALAALLSLPEKSEGGNGLSVEQWKNKPFYFNSFRVSQRDMLDSLNRVLGTKDEEWEIRYEKTGERYQAGLEELKRGERNGFAKAMYTRVFFPTGDGDFESTRGTANQALGLEKESLDEATKRAVEMVESGWTPFG